MTETPIHEQRYCAFEPDWKERYEEEYRIVDRCWKALGITTYEQAGGKAVWEIVSEHRQLLHELAALETGNPPDVLGGISGETARALKARLLAVL